MTGTRTRHLESIWMVNEWTKWNNTVSCSLPFRSEALSLSLFLFLSLSLSNSQKLLLVSLQLISRILSPFLISLLARQLLMIPVVFPLSLSLSPPSCFVSDVNYYIRGNPWMNERTLFPQKMGWPSQLYLNLYKLINHPFLSLSPFS